MLEMKRYDDNKWREVVFPVKVSDFGTHAYAQICLRKSIRFGFWIEIR